MGIVLVVSAGPATGQQQPRSWWHPGPYDWKADFPLDQDKLPKFEMRLQTFSGIAIPTDDEVNAYGSH